jgi:membrane protease YdiL (CAAX protease family)
MFSTSTVIADLAGLRAGISLALPDLSPDRAAVVRRLNAAGIPVTAWLALPKEQGYFFNAGNAPAAARRFDEFEVWSVRHGLRWAAVGLDIEPDVNELQFLARGGVGRLVPALMVRALDHRHVLEAKRCYQNLIGRIRARGYPVEVYQLFFMADERRARSTLLERLLGVVDVSGDRNCLMLYTSFHHSWGASVIRVYGADAGRIVIGSTGGDSPLDAGFVPLGWDEFLRDLRVASRWTNDIGVYSLEGCVRQRMLARLKGVDWTQDAPPGPAAWQPRALRAAIAAVLWVDRYAYVIFGLFAGSVGVAVWRLRNPLITYFVLAFSISWAGGLALTSRYWMRGEAVPKMSGLLMFPAMLLGPSIAGLLLTYTAQGNAGVRSLFSHMRRIGSPRWLAALAIPPGLVLGVLLGMYLLVSPVFVPNHFWIGVTFGCAAGFFEEIGWTGFAFPMMRLKRSAFRAGILLGLIWSLWHIPVIEYLGSATPHGPYLIQFFLAFLAAMTAMRILICWVYCATQSLLLAQLLHASSTGALAVLGPAQVTARQEATWYAVYALALWIVVAVITKRVSPALARKD